jgi:hypothetical protein
LAKVVNTQQFDTAGPSTRASGVQLSDNRVAAFEADTSTCTFAHAAEGKAIVDVTLLFRRQAR